MSYILKKQETRINLTSAIQYFTTPFFFRVNFKQEMQVKKIADQKFIIFQFDKKFLRSYFNQTVLRKFECKKAFKTCMRAAVFRVCDVRSQFCTFLVKKGPILDFLAKKDYFFLHFHGPTLP